MDPYRFGYSPIIERPKLSWPNNARVAVWVAPNIEHYEYLPESVGQFPQGDALAARMRAAGLDDVACYPLTLGVATLYVGRKLAPGSAGGIVDG